MVMTITRTRMVIVSVKERSATRWRDLTQIMPLPLLGGVTSLTLSDLEHH